MITDTTTTELTADQAETLAEIQINIAETLEAGAHATMAADAALGAVGRAMGPGETVYTSTVLAALAAWTRVDCEDEDGAQLLERMAQEYARHEATVV